MHESLDALKAEISSHGMLPPDQIEPGKLIRFSDNGGKNKNGWCILNINPDGSAGAAFGNWKDINQKWFHTPDGKPLSKKQQQDFSKQVDQARKKADRELKEKQAQAAKKANSLWSQAKDTDPNHRYLVKKKIDPSGIKQSGKALIIPVYDDQEKITSLQQILPDGTKKFMPGGKIQGGFFPIGSPGLDDTVYIAEGLATGTSIHGATSKPCVIAFNSGNLKLVAQIFKDRYPDKKIIVAADNDLETEKRTGSNPGRVYGEEAARAIGAELVLCPVNSDFNDLRQVQGIDAVRQALKRTCKININDWEKPISLKENNSPQLDPEILTGIVGDMARAVSNETETPFELSAGLILAVLGTACQGKFVVKIKPGYQEPVNIWTVTALDPANRKSSVLMKITDPLSKWESLKHSELEPWIKEATSKLQNQLSRIKSLRAQYGKAQQNDLKTIENEILDIENNLVQVPIYPKLWAQDVTPEYLGTLLNNHGEVMSIISAEGGIFDIIGGRYSNGIANLDLFLQGHSGDPVRVDRGSREPVFLNSPALTLGLSPQPEVLRGLADKPGFRGKGLLARFLYLLPKSNLGHRSLESEPAPEHVEKSYQSLIHTLLDIEQPEDEHGNKQPYILQLSNPAYQEWLEFARVVEVELKEGGRFEYITDWAGKLPGAAARIAGLLHCAKNSNQPWSKDIEIETMGKALEIASVFASHALIAFDMMGADKALEQAKKVWRWIERDKQGSFTKRDCFNALKGTFHRVVNIEEPLKVLIERNHIRELPKRKIVGKPSIKYAVNPEILKGW